MMGARERERDGRTEPTKSWVYHETGHEGLFDDDERWVPVFILLFSTSSILSERNDMDTYLIFDS